MTARRGVEGVGSIETWAKGSTGRSIEGSEALPRTAIYVYCDRVVRYIVAGELGILQFVAYVYGDLSGALLGSILVRAWREGTRAPREFSARRVGSARGHKSGFSADMHPVDLGVELHPDRGGRALLHRPPDHRRE